MALSAICLYIWFRFCEGATFFLSLDEVLFNRYNRERLNNR